MTADGPCDPSQIGITLIHEHVLIDLRAIAPLPAGGPARQLATAPLTIEVLGPVARDPTRCQDNLLLDDFEIAVSELARFAAQGGGTIVDVTPVGIRVGEPAAIAALARRAGLRAVVGTGYYLHSTHPAEITGLGVDAIAERMRRDALEGIGESAVRAGVIGEIGVGLPFEENEWKVLEAACVAQLATGLPLCVHPAFDARGGNVLEITRFALDAGIAPERLNLCHMDVSGDLDLQREVLAAGCWISYDTFGFEAHFDDSPGGRRAMPDVARETHLATLLDEGFGDRLLLSQDVATKMQLRRFGGHGYAHLLENVLPQMRWRGGDAGLLRSLLVDNPRRYLTIA